MNKTATFIIHNLWWMIPLAVVLLFWQHASPILLMLIIAYLVRIILNPAVILIEKWLGSRRLAVFSIMTLLIVLLIILSSSLFPLIKNQIVAFQTVLSMETLGKFQTKLTLILESILPVFLFNIFRI